MIQDDIEKTRVEYVTRLEETLQHMKRQLDEAKPLADRWTPVVASENTGTDLRVTVGFGGKRVTVTVPTASFVTSDATSLTSNIVDSVIANIVFDQFASMIRPEVEKTIRAVSGIQGAGQW